MPQKKWGPNKLKMLPKASPTAVTMVPSRPPQQVSHLQARGLKTSWDFVKY
ncbi:hypothetical protein LEMLEM_LOCUS19025 [Lemmus lemmus]